MSPTPSRNASVSEVDELPSSPCSPLEIRLLLAIQDATWALDHNCPIAALAILRDVATREQGQPVRGAR